MGVPLFPAMGVPVFPGAPFKSKLTEAKARQATRIRELGGALTASGLVTLDEQARALGLSRSSAWAVLKANHKTSGLAAGTINQMLSSQAFAPARACDDFDLHRGEACRSLRPQQNAIAPICSGARPCARAVCLQCSRGYSRLDHRQVGSLVMSIGHGHTRRTPPGSQPGGFRFKMRVWPTNAKSKISLLNPTVSLRS